MGRISLIMGVLSFREYFKITIFVVVAVIVVDSHVSYKDVHVFRIDAKNERQLDQVKAVRAAYPTDHMWRVTRSLVHLAYPKQEAHRVSAALTKRDHSRRRRGDRGHRARS